MNDRWQQIIKEFLATTELLTSEQLANRLNVSSKTIRNDLKNLSDFLNSDSGAQIDSFRGKGYRLQVFNESSFKQFLRKSTNNIEGIVPTEPQDRIQYLIESLLLQSNYLRIDDLSEELFVSRSTLQTDLKSVRNIFNQYDLTIKQKPNYGIKVHGDEIQIRFCISEHVFNQKYTILNQIGDKLKILPIHEIEMVCQH